MTTQYTDKQRLQMALEIISNWDNTPWSTNEIDERLRSARVKPEGIDEPTQEEIDRVLAYVEARGWRCVPPTLTDEMISAGKVMPSVWRRLLHTAPEFEVKK